MVKIKSAVLVVATGLAVACSNVANPGQAPQASFTGEFTPGTRTQFDGILLDVGSGGRLGLIDIQVSSLNPGRVFAETIFLQRHPAGSPFDATSQVVEIDCPMHRHRVVANLGYRRDGNLLNVVPVESAFTGFAVYQGAYDQICDGSHSRHPVARFTTIAEFLDLFDRPDV